MMLSSVTDPMMTTTMMMMSPPKKARHSYHSYLDTGRIFLNSCSSSSGNGLGRDGYSPRSIPQSSHGSQVPRELLVELEEYRLHGSHPGSQSRAVHPPQGSSSKTALHPSQENSMSRGYSLDLCMVGLDPGTQRTSRPFNIEHQSLRVDTIELPRRTTMTPSFRAEANDAPLDLTTLSADKLTRTFDDQTFPRSGNSIPFFTARSSGGDYDFRSQTDNGQRSKERRARPELPLFVNLENSKLESIQLGLQSGRGNEDTTEKENNEMKSVPSGWKRMRDFEMDPEVEQPPRRPKNAIDRLRAHLERRQENMPSSSTAYASLSKHLAVIEATGNRYEAAHDTMFGELQGAKATRLKTSFRSATEVDTQGQSYSHFHSEKESPIRHPEGPDKQKRCLSGLTIGGPQQRQNGQRLNETDPCLQNIPRREEEQLRNGGQSCAATLDNDDTFRKGHSSGVAFEGHPTDHSHMFDQSMGQVQTDIQLQDRVLTETPLDLHPSKHPNFSAWIHASEATRAGRPRRAEAHPDSPSSHSLPDFSRRSDNAVSTQSQTTRRPASIDTGFPSSEKRIMMNDDEAAVMMEMGGDGGGLSLVTPSPDQSTNYINYSTDNLPAIIASARLDDDYEFTASLVDAPKETTARDNHHPIDKSPKASFWNRKNAVRSGSVGTALSSSPEPPSSTFEDESVADKSKDEDNNTKLTESAIPCKICQDVANGFHYGVWSCEGCKAFFKRSITGSAKYVCPADNNCTINRLRKKSCQACRLRKCYEYGMSPGNCRGENGSKMRKRKLPEADRNEDTRNINSVNGDDRRMNGASNQSNVRFSTPTVHHNFHGHPTVAEPASGSESILQHLLAVERPIRFADFTDVRTAMDPADSERIQWLTSITKLVNLQLMDVVTWSRSVPGFRTLNLNIRTHLLVSSWSEILLLTNAFYSMQCVNAIVMAPNLHLTKERCEVIGLTALYNRMMSIVKSFQQLAMTHNEMLLMQALLLVNADLTAPQLIPRLDGLRASLMRSWNQSCAAGSQGQGPVDYDRISRVLMLMPHIRHCSLLFQRFLTDVKRDIRIPFHGFLQEVTDGRHEFDQVSILELLVEEEAGL